MLQQLFRALGPLVAEVERERARLAAVKPPAGEEGWSPAMAWWPTAGQLHRYYLTYMGENQPGEATVAVPPGEYRVLANNDLGMHCSQEDFSEICILPPFNNLRAQVIKPGDVVIFESTVFPGATEEECIPLIEAASGLKYNQDFFAGYSPERINPGDKQHRLETDRKSVV